MALRDIAILDLNECLRKKSRTVEKIDKRVLVLLEDMLDTMYYAQGVGIAAPQVGVLKRIMIVDVGNGPIEFINPEMIEQSGEQIDTEGCLSVPGLAGNVTRPSYVKVKALDRNGKSFELEGTALLARAICHEMDHLDGVLFVDRCEPFEKTED
jgi:peptide deformylase